MTTRAKARKLAKQPGMLGRSVTKSLVAALASSAEAYQLSLASGDELFAGLQREIAVREERCAQLRAIIDTAILELFQLRDEAEETTKKDLLEKLQGLEKRLREKVK